MNLKNRPWALWVLMLALVRPATAAITIDTTNPSDWKISNGMLRLDWNSKNGNIFSIHMTGRTDNLVDVTNKFSSTGQPKGLYMDNAGVGTGTGTAGFKQTAGYLDWWLTTPSSSTNAFTYTTHFIVTDNDPGVHVYFVANHAATDISGNLGQVQYVYRVNKSLFTTTFSMDSALNDRGPTSVTLPNPTVLGNTEAGRQVQDATLDLHGLPVPAGYTRNFYTKYDFSSFEYLHRAHGVYGPALGAWVVIPRSESLVGGPTKQNLIFTGSILIMEALSNHLNNALSYSAPQGVASSRLFGPYYFRLNAFDTTRSTPDALYQEALSAASTFDALYDNEAQLLQSGHVASNQRGTVQVKVSGGASAANRSWVVLSDAGGNFQYSTAGRQYWASLDSSGAAVFNGVVPGSYRLSSYVLGQWGELRQDGITTVAGGTTVVNATFKPENFGTSRPIWTIGTHDRSAHEFLHGHTAAGQDERQYWGNWNYWSDFAATQGAVNYFATAVGSTAATNDLTKWNYVHWRNFNPGLFAGVFDSADTTTDGFKFVCPAYIGNCSTAVVPPWKIHFTTTRTQRRQGQFVTLSLGLAATGASLTATLNGQQLVWPGLNVKNSNPQVRSGQTGTYQWLVFEWPSSMLGASGSDNVITLSPSRSQGVMYDALRMEIASRSAEQSSTGWHDYEYVSASGYEAAVDSVSNNN